MHLPASAIILATIFSSLTTCLAQTTSITQSVSVISTEIVAATVTITQAAPTTPESASYTDATDLRTSILNSTNFYRYEHGANFLFWNTSLASYAQNWANKCIWEHSHGPSGENLAQGYVDVTSSVDAWGDERAMYSWKGTQTGFTEATGHFTQLVWKDTTSVGCAAVDCKGVSGGNIEGVFLVCEYWPAGNIVGNNDQYFEDNVGKQVNQGSGFNVASATNPATTTSGSSQTGSAGSASPTNGMGSEAAERVGGRRGWWAVAAVMGALGLAGGMA
jgi:uncharacterized protein YkwD